MERYHDIVNFPITWVSDSIQTVIIPAGSTVSMKLNLSSGAEAKSLWSVRVSCVCVPVRL